MKGLSNVRSTEILVARCLLSAIFLFAGTWKLCHHDLLYASMTNHHVPFACFLSYIATTIEWIAGIALCIGFFTRYVSWLLFLYMLPLTYYYHAFWQVTPNDFALQFNLFIKNVAIMGGLMALAASGGQRWSLDFLLNQGE